jgi:hypothetical protein
VAATGIDAPVPDRARARFPDAKVTWLNGGVLTCPLEPASSGAALSNAALHHLPDTRAALRRLGELIKPGGTPAVAGFPRTRGGLPPSRDRLHRQPRRHPGPRQAGPHRADRVAAPGRHPRTAPGRRRCQPAQLACAPGIHDPGPAPAAD